MGQGSGADEYTEDIPGGGGNNPSNQNNGGSGSGSDGTGSGSTLPSGTQADLAAQGDDGAAAANLAQQTGPGGNGNGNGAKSNGAGSGDGAGAGSGSGGDVNLTPADSDSSGSGVGDVVADLAGGSDDGMGLLLPIILGSVLIAAVAFVLIRRGGGSPGSA